MHHEAVKSNLCGSSKGYECDHQPLCPRPRKLSPAIPDFLKPHRCTSHRSHPDAKEEESGILSMITEKNSDEKELVCGTCTAGCFGSCYYSGSPPQRTENPLIHDVHFLHQMHMNVPPFSSHAKLSDNFAIHL